MEWNQVLEHPSLQNIPFKVELNEWGKIVMTPASNLHGNLQMKIAMKLMQLLNEGEVSVEVSIQTSKNVKVADVAWASADFISQHGFETPYSMAPEICVEVISPGNTQGKWLKRESCILPKGQRRCGSVMRVVRWNSSLMKAGLWNHGFVLIFLRISVNNIKLRKKLLQLPSFVIINDRPTSFD